MKVIMMMFDSLNRHFLPSYGCDWVKTPNFERLAERTVTFDNCYAGSLPCMPARREMHTGRYNFLHRSWGPIEPFDDSVPEILRNNGIYSHLISDHFHYWDEGGATYHNRFSSWEVVRGQEGEHWKGLVHDPEIPDNLNRPWRHDWINRQYMQREEDTCLARNFALAQEFIKQNHQDDNWFLQIENFDPHEPFFTPENWQELYPHDYLGPFFDWPDYQRVEENPEQVQHIRYLYAALLSMCDHYLGKLLDLMDDLKLWDDTMLIVNTDHGFLLGEHGWWAKCVQPFFNEVVHLPLFIWDPRSEKSGERRNSLVQTIDLAPTLLEYFDLDISADMQGKALGQTLVDDHPVRTHALFGMHGVHVNCTDGRYVYMRAPINQDSRPQYEYTLMPTHMRSRFSVEELQNMALTDPLSFSKGCRVLRIQAAGGMPGGEPMEMPSENLLFDLENDPDQEHPIQDTGIEKKMIGHLTDCMQDSDAPMELFGRLGL